MDHFELQHYIRDLGATHCQSVSPRLLVPEERVWSFCKQNRCGRFRKHLMCPPNNGTIAEIERSFESFDNGMMIQYERHLDVQNDPAGVLESKMKLHRIVIETEKFLRNQWGCQSVMGLMGGDCALCDECAGYRGEACPQPDKARPSLEALAVDVMALLRKLELDTVFHPDRIIWTGMVLFCVV